MVNNQIINGVDNSYITDINRDNDVNNFACKLLVYSTIMPVAPAAVKYFSATMTIDDFVSFLSKEGVPPKDCQIILGEI